MRRTGSTGSTGLRKQRRDTTQRRGFAVAVVILLVFAVSGLGILAIRQGRLHMTHGTIFTDQQRAYAIADACAAGAVKVLPGLLNVYIATQQATGEIPSMVHEQFDDNYLGDYPFGDESPRNADCTVEILEIQDDDPAPGYSLGGGCFKSVSLQASAWVYNDGVADSADMTQNIAETQGDVMVRGLFGPTECN